MSMPTNKVLIVPGVEEGDFPVPEVVDYFPRVAVRQLAGGCFAVAGQEGSAPVGPGYFDSRFVYKSFHSNSIRFRMTEVLRNRQLADLLR